jgi:hypothetical protein
VVGIESQKAKKPRSQSFEVKWPTKTACTVPAPIYGMFLASFYPLKKLYCNENLLRAPIDSTVQLVLYKRVLHNFTAVLNYRPKPTVTIEQWALIGYCLFTLSWFGQFGQTIGTGHYYFDEMRSSFNLVQNQLFALTKLNIYKTNCLNISNHSSMHHCRKRERKIKSPWNFGSLKH